MRRRVISVGSVMLAVAALGVVLLNATLVDRRGPAINGVRLSAAVEGQANLAHTLTAIDIAFSEPVRTVTVERRFRISPYVAGAISWDGSTAIFTPSDRLPQDTEFIVSIGPGFEDLAGNVAETGLEAWTFRTVGPPTVIETVPADGTEGVLLDGTVAVTFDRLMDTSAVETAISVDPVVRVRPTWSGRVLTLAFEGDLRFGTAYTVTIDTDAADTDGSRLREPFVLRFTTAEAGLGLVRTVPAHGTAGVSVGSPIAVVFDGPIDPGSIDDALSVTPPIGGDVRIVPLPNDEAPPGAEPPPGTVLVLDPGDPLAAHTTYTVTLAPSVTLAGAPDVVAEGSTWTFTTGQPTASGHNQIAYLTARGGNRDVWLMNPDGSAQRQLTGGLAPVSAFDVTLDGTRVAFASGGVVRLMAIDGTGETVLTGDDRLEYAPRFSPDGRRLVLARRAADGTDQGWWLVPLDAAAGEEVQLTPGGAPPLGSTALPGDGIEPNEGQPAWAGRAAWDPSGRWLLLTTAQGAVVLVDVDAGPPAAVALPLTAASAPAWSAAGDRFLVVGRATNAESDALHSVDTDGTVRERSEGFGSVAVDPDGRVAMLLRDEAGLARLALGGIEGDRPPEIMTSGEGLADRWPAFSPDGSAVVFGRVRDEGTTSAGIWSMETAGGSPVRLTTDGAYPRWLP